MTALSSRPEGVARIVYFQILKGDRRKAQARSNDDPSQGGGARDLRFPDAFWDVLTRMFPNPKRKSRRDRSSGQSHTIDVFSGNLSWFDPSGREHSSTVEVWPATHARPTEIRLARIHEVDVLANIPAAQQGNLFLFLVQDDDSSVRAHYGDDSLLKNPAFNRDVARTMQTCATATRIDARVMGYIDYDRGTSYCHGE